MIVRDDNPDHPSWRACCPLPTEKALPQSARANIIAFAILKRGEP